MLLEDPFGRRINTLFRTKKGKRTILSLSEEEIRAKIRETFKKAEEKKVDCRKGTVVVEVESKGKKVIMYIPHDDATLLCVCFLKLSIL